MVFSPGFLAALCRWRLDFARRHLPRLGVAPPVTILSSLLLCLCNSHPNSGVAVTTSVPLRDSKQRRNSKSFASMQAPYSKMWPAESRPCTSSSLQAFQESQAGVNALRKERRGFIEYAVPSLGGRRPFRYWVSNARSAASTVGPIPTIPSSRLTPSNAIQRSPRKNNWGRRTADGLPGWAAQ